MPQNQMTKEDSSRIQSTQAKSGGDMGFASRAQSAADSRANNNNSGGGGGQSKGTDAANKKG
ncbi:unnamed protein product [Clonostachys chloroleuca]|uniref:SMP domain-containing protein n=1 Tax=Clonostachys chloroleuca TaxID=1926264 RepID=A0AA35M0M4_9HYPO|nr:unnamed protein product [Clonostachys chloroleuca]